MSALVESGSARCPRCMAPADYKFFEDDADTVRYEVSCSTCSHVHRETCTSPPALVA